MTPEEIRDMNERSIRRRNDVETARTVPIYGPKWAAKVVDTGAECLAIHRDTGEPYPLDVHGDLDIEDHAVLVLQRMILDGATTIECERLVRAFGLPAYAKARLLWQLREDA